MCIDKATSLKRFKESEKFMSLVKDLITSKSAIIFKINIVELIDN